MDIIKEIEECEKCIEENMKKYNLSENDLNTVEEMARMGDRQREVDFDINIAIEVALLKQRLDILKNIAD